MKSEKILYRWASKTAAKLMRDWHKHERLKQRRAWYESRIAGQQDAGMQAEAQPAEAHQEQEPLRPDTM